MPYTGIVLTIVSLHGAAFLILLSHWLVAAGLFPKATEQFAQQYGARPIRALLVGVFTFGPLLLLLLNSAKIPGAGIRLLVVIAGALAILIALVGSAGLALRIGRNLSGEASRWQQCLRGGVMLALVFITPVIGWVLLLAVGLASGFGAFLLSRPWKSAVTATNAVNEPVLAKDPAPATTAPALS
jgi:hypothetical protein